MRTLRGGKKCPSLNDAKCRLLNFYVLRQSLVTDTKNYKSVICVKMLVNLGGR